MILDLFQYQLSNRQSIGMLIMNEFLRPRDWCGLYGSCSFFKTLLMEKCPICKIPIESRKKYNFHRVIQGRIFSLPRAPCGTRTCSRHIMGHYVKKNQYSLRLFSKKFDPTKLARWEQLASDNRKDEYQFQMEYRRSGYSIQMSRMSFSF